MTRFWYVAVYAIQGYHLSVHGLILHPSGRFQLPQAFRPFADLSGARDEVFVGKR